MTQQLRTFDGGLVTFNTEKLEKLIQTHSNIFLLDFILCSFNFLFIQPYLNQLLCVPLLPPCRHVQSVQWYEQLRGFSLINTIVTSAATFLPTSTSTNPCTRPPSCFCNTTLILNESKGWKVAFLRIFTFTWKRVKLLLVFVILIQDWDRDREWPRNDR